MKRMAVVMLLMAASGFAIGGDTQAVTPIPKHLELARELVATVKPENNKYVILGNRGVHWKGDLFTSENSVNTACIGFVKAVLERANSPAIEEIKSKTRWTKWLELENYYEAITKGYGFTQIFKMGDTQPGDLFMFWCNDQRSCGNSQASEVQGHITIIDVKPTLKNPTPPIIEGTQQWVVTIIDSADNPHSKDDTRVVPPGMPKITGVGRGTYRIYSDMNGIPVGYTSGPNGPKFFGISDRPIAIGRPFPY